jgi:hypothetical protein
MNNKVIGLVTARASYAIKYTVHCIYLCKLDAHSSRFDTIQFEFHGIFILYSIYQLQIVHGTILKVTVKNFYLTSIKLMGKFQQPASTYSSYSAASLIYCTFH